MIPIAAILILLEACFALGKVIDLEYDASLASNGWQSECIPDQFGDTTCQILGYEPEISRDPRPLFVWVPCTGGKAKYNLPQYFTREMSERGYVSVSFDYPDPVQNIYLLEEKTNTLFNASNPNTPLSIMCARENVDCSLGVAVAGFSQGTHITLLSSTVNSNVSATYTIEGARVTWPSGSGSTMCDNVNIEPYLPKNKRRYILGEGDIYYAWEPIDGSNGFKPSLEEAITNNKILSGYDCEDNRDCIQEDGSGYFVTTTEDCVPVPREACPPFGVPNHTNWAGGKTSDIAIAPWFDNDSDWGVRASLDWLAEAARKSTG